MRSISDRLVPPINRTLSDVIVRDLRKRIILGNLRPGERLTEVRLAAEYGVSRGTVREVFRRLEAESLIEKTSHRRSRVSRLEPSDAYEICILHALLEEHCVRHTKLPLEGDAQAELKRVIDEMAELRLPDEVDRFIDLDQAFHLTLVNASGQRRVVQVWKGLRSLLGVLVALSLQYLEGFDARRIASRHRTILEAVRQTETDIAAEAVSSHYRILADQIMMIVSAKQETSGAFEGQTRD